MKKSAIFLFLTLLLSFFAITNSVTAEEPSPFEATSAPIKVDLIPEEETILPGHPFWVAIRLNLEHGWHAYWKNPGDAGMAIEIDWQLPTGFVAGDFQWPYPQRFDLSSMIGYGYEGDVWLLAQITPPQSMSNGSQVEISANVNWLVCSDSTCLPGLTMATAKMAVDHAPPKPQKLHISDFGKARRQIPQKQWSMHAKRTEGLIELNLEAPAHYGRTFSGADFFPEHKNMIDHKVQAVLTGQEGQPENYTIILKDRDTEDTKAPFLKGVVVLRSDDGAVEALEVHVPIRGGLDEDPVAMAEPHGQNAGLTVDEVHYDKPAGEFEGGVGLALILAFIGGLLLNLMPCVLPVISFKVLSFVKMSGQSRALTLKHGVAFGAGVILSFWALAGIMLLLQAYGRSVGWGFQLQEPIFVAILASLLLIFGLSMFGVMEMGTSLTSLASKAEGSSTFGLVSSFLSGILATAVATPCTGPFLGSAIGFAVTLPPLLALLIFTSLGLGMASPYLILAAYPKLMKFIPKPGAWMVTFKEIMGFLMLATVLWLTWVFGAQTNSLGLTLLLAAFLCLAMGCWVYGKWGTPVKSKISRLVSFSIVLMCFSLAGYIIAKSTSPKVIAYESAKTQKDDNVWQAFSESKVADLQKKGIPVFVDFTAKWCLICQTNHLVLSTPEVSAKFDELGVVRMKADWTRNDPKITEALRKFGRNGVPLYVLYVPGGQPKILPQVLTPDNVLDHLTVVSSR